MRPSQNLIFLLIPSAWLGAQTPVSVTAPSLEFGASRYRYTGSITSLREAALSPRVSGLVETADIEMGYVAEKGEPLVKLDSTLAAMDLREAEIMLDTAKEEAANAELRLNEAVELGDLNFPRSERENRHTNFEKAKLAITRLETLVEREKELVERHRIVAPFDGVVVEKNAEVGEWVQTGNPVLRLVDVDNLRLDLEVPQEQLPVILSSEVAQVQVTGFEHERIEAPILSRSPRVDSATRTFQVRLSLDGSLDFVKPGMSADAIFQPQSEIPRLVVPRDAILRNGDNEVIIWVAKSAGDESRAERHVVTLGHSSGSKIEVLSGLGPDDQVIVQGNELLLEDQVIRIVDSVTRSNFR